jgi:hypothetical protein
MHCRTLGGEQRFCGTILATVRLVLTQYRGVVVALMLVAVMGGLQTAMWTERLSARPSYQMPVEPIGLNVGYGIRSHHLVSAGCISNDYKAHLPHVARVPVSQFPFASEREPNNTFQQANGALVSGRA